MKINVELILEYQVEDQWYSSKVRGIYNCETLKISRISSKLKLVSNKKRNNKMLIKLFLDSEDIVLKIDCGNKTVHSSQNVNVFGYIRSGNIESAKKIFFENRMKIYDNEFFYIFKKIGLSWFDRCIGTNATFEKKELLCLVDSSCWSQMEKISSGVLDKKECKLALENIIFNIHNNIKDIHD